MTKMEDSEVYLLDQRQIAHYWPEIWGRLDEDQSLWDRWFTRESLAQRIKDDHMQVWVVLNAGGLIVGLFLTQMLVSDTGKVLQVFWARGELSDGALRCIESALDTFGAHHECASAVVIGRRGFEKRLKPLGFKFEGVVLGREIKPRGNGHAHQQ